MVQQQLPEAKHHPAPVIILGEEVERVYAYKYKSCNHWTGLTMRLKHLKTLLPVCGGQCTLLSCGVLVGWHQDW